MPREWNTNVRESWNTPINQILKAIDNHTQLFLETNDYWHEEKSSILRNYVNELKTWIHKEERNNNEK